MNSNFVLPQGYLNPVLNNPAQFANLMLLLLLFFFNDYSQNLKKRNFTFSVSF